MRLLPASLFGRLVVVLVAGFVLAVSVGVAIYVRERGALLQQAGAIGAARHYAVHGMVYHRHLSLGQRPLNQVRVAA